MSDLTNIGKSSLNPLKRALLIQSALDEQKLSKIELAKLIHKSPSYISNHLRLLKLPELVRDALLSDLISEGHARSLSYLDDEADVLKVYENILKLNYSVREVENEVAKLRKHKQEYGKVAPEIKKNAQYLADKLQCSVNVTRRDRKIILSFVLPLGILAHQRIKKLKDALDK